MKKKIDLTNKVVVVTGAARGIGQATASEFAHRGARVALGDIDTELVQRTAESIGPDALGLQLDVTDADSFARFLDQVEAALGPVDVLVNNAGIMPAVRLEDESLDSVNGQIDINLRGVIHGTKEAIARMRANGRQGHIVNVASAAGKVAFPGLATYHATKFAVVGLTTAVAAEMHAVGITFSLVMPGIVRTELTVGVDDIWALRSVDPSEVGQRIVEATIKRRFEVAVPRTVSVLARAVALLPANSGRVAAKLIGEDLFTRSHNDPQRAEYERRAALSEGPPKRSG